MDSFIKSLTFNPDVFYSIIDHDGTEYCLNCNPNGTFTADEGYPPRFFHFATPEEVFTKFNGAKSITMVNTETDQDTVFV
jgi:hypothetical protein